MPEPYEIPSASALLPAAEQGAELAGHNSDLVRISILKSFEKTVRECGGEASKLAEASGLAPDLLSKTDTDLQIDFARVVDLFNKAATALGRPDFGLMLASGQSSVGVAAPIALVMKNSTTLGDAFRFSAERADAYSQNAAFTVIKDSEYDKLMLRLDIWLAGTFDARQAIEHALLRIYLMVLHLSGGTAQPREVWFTHEPIGPVTLYRKYFGIVPRFSQQMNAVVLDPADEQLDVVGRDDEVLRMAKDFIEERYAIPHQSFEHRVRKHLSQRRSLRGASTSDVAARLGMHPRTFQRRLKAEGVRFDEIKDQVSREAALKYLRFSNLPLIRIANLLGFSELSAFSHKCRRWFSASPRELRRTLRGMDSDRAP